MSIPELKKELTWAKRILAVCVLSMILETIHASETWQANKYWKKEVAIRDRVMREKEKEFEFKIQEQANSFNRDIKILKESIMMACFKGG